MKIITTIKRWFIPKRRIIAVVPITVLGNTRSIHVFCNDGTIWSRSTLSPSPEDGHAWYPSKIHQIPLS